MYVNEGFSSRSIFNNEPLRNALHVLIPYNGNYTAFCLLHPEV